jgi:YD repeat-containing protein
MPFEQVHGNGGLLTTVGDLLRWTHNLETGELGGPELLAEMHRQGVLRSGREISYASGLVVTDYRGVAEVQHGGATAGYRAFLMRFPDQDVGVAVLCNRADANPGRLAHEVADLYLGDALADEDDDGPDVQAAQVDPATLEALAGAYRNTRTHGRTRLVFQEGELTVEGRLPLTPVSATAFVGSGARLEVDEEAGHGERGMLRLIQDGDTVRLEPVEPFDPTPADLQAYVGTYHSPDAEVTYTTEVRDGGLVLVDRYGEGRPIAPLYPDAFGGGGNTFRFMRDDSGRVVEMRWSQSRVWDLRFERVR